METPNKANEAVLTNSLIETTVHNFALVHSRDAQMRVKRQSSNLI